MKRSPDPLVRVAELIAYFEGLSGAGRARGAASGEVAVGVVGTTPHDAWNAFEARDPKAAREVLEYAQQGLRDEAGDMDDAVMRAYAALEPVDHKLPARTRAALLVNLVTVGERYPLRAGARSGGIPAGVVPGGGPGWVWAPGHGGGVSVDAVTPGLEGAAAAVAPIGLRLVNVEGDGDCFYSAFIVAAGLRDGFGRLRTAAGLREELAGWLADCVEDERVWVGIDPFLVSTDGQGPVQRRLGLIATIQEPGVWDNDHGDLVPYVVTLVFPGVELDWLPYREGVDVENNWEGWGESGRGRRRVLLVRFDPGEGLQHWAAAVPVDAPVLRETTVPGTQAGRQAQAGPSRQPVGRAWPAQELAGEAFARGSSLFSDDSDMDMAEEDARGTGTHEEGMSAAFSRDPVTGGSGVSRGPDDGDAMHIGDPADAVFGELSADGPLGGRVFDGLSMDPPFDNAGASVDFGGRNATPRSAPAGLEVAGGPDGQGVVLPGVSVGPGGSLRAGSRSQAREPSVIDVDARILAPTQAAAAALGHWTAYPWHAAPTPHSFGFAPHGTQNLSPAQVVALFALLDDRNNADATIGGVWDHVRALHDTVLHPMDLLNLHQRYHRPEYTPNPGPQMSAPRKKKRDSDIRLALPPFGERGAIRGKILTRKKAAEILGVSPTALKFWESKDNPSRDNHDAYLAFLTFLAEGVGPDAMEQPWYQAAVVESRIQAERKRLRPSVDALTRTRSGRLDPRTSVQTQAEKKKLMLPLPSVRREIREGTGLTQIDLSNIIKASPELISDWEDRSSPHLIHFDSYVAMLSLLAEVHSERRRLESQEWYVAAVADWHVRAERNRLVSARRASAPTGSIAMANTGDAMTSGIEAEAFFAKSHNVESVEQKISRHWWGRESRPPTAEDREGVGTFYELSPSLNKYFYRIPLTKDVILKDRIGLNFVGRDRQKILNGKDAVFLESRESALSAFAKDAGVTSELSNKAVRAHLDDMTRNHYPEIEDRYLKRQNLSESFSDGRRTFEDRNRLDESGKVVFRTRSLDVGDTRVSVHHEPTVRRVWLDERLAWVERAVEYVRAAGFTVPNLDVWIPKYTRSVELYAPKPGRFSTRSTGVGDFVEVGAAGYGEGGIIIGELTPVRHNNLPNEFMASRLGEVEIGLIVHEIGHRLQDQFLLADSLAIALRDPSTLDLMGRVSEYAVSGATPAEFVAEYFTGLVFGRPYREELGAVTADYVEQLYHDLGGPRPSSERRESLFPAPPPLDSAAPLTERVNAVLGERGTPGVVDADQVSSVYRDVLTPYERRLNLDRRAARIADILGAEPMTHEDASAAGGSAPGLRGGSRDAALDPTELPLGHALVLEGPRTGVEPAAGRFPDPDPAAGKGPRSEVWTRFVLPAPNRSGPPLFGYEVDDNGTIRFHEGARTTLLPADRWTAYGHDFLHLDEGVLLRGDTGWIGRIDNWDTLQATLDDPLPTHTVHAHTHAVHVLPHPDGPLPAVALPLVPGDTAPTPTPTPDPDPVEQPNGKEDPQDPPVSPADPSGVVSAAAVTNGQRAVDAPQGSVPFEMSVEPLDVAGRAMSGDAEVDTAQDPLRVRARNRSVLVPWTKRGKAGALALEALLTGPKGGPGSRALVVGAVPGQPDEVLWAVNHEGVVGWQTNGGVQVEAPEAELDGVRSINLNPRAQLIDPPEQLKARGPEATSFCHLTPGMHRHHIV